MSALLTNSTNSPPAAVSTRYATRAWNHKAMANETLASKTVGGFSADEKRLYHVGLEHLSHQHQAVGSLTIGQVVTQEGQREQQEVTLAKQAIQRATQERQTAEERHFFHGTPDCLVLDDRTLGTESGEGEWYILGKVTNQCAQDFGYVQVEIGFLDSDGNLVSSDMGNVNNLHAGQSWSFRIPEFDTTGSKWRIEGITGN